MKPRAMVFTLFGDYLRYCGSGEAKLGALSELLKIFDVDAGTTRVVMTRLRKDGWFDTVKDGREVRYVLSANGWRLMDEGRQRIFLHPESRWSGTWTMVIARFAEVDRGAREAARKQLAWLGYGQLTPSTWMSPHDRLSQVSELFATLPVVTLDMMQCRGRDLDHDRDMARRCWDLDALNEDYRNFIETFDRPDALGLTGADALAYRVQLTDSYRMFPFRDPDLPSELLPEGWLGTRAHAVFTQMHDALAAEAEGAVEKIVGLPLVRSGTNGLVRGDRGLPESAVEFDASREDVVQ